MELLLFLRSKASLIMEAFKSSCFQKATGATGATGALKFSRDVQRLAKIFTIGSEFTFKSIQKQQNWSFTVN